MSNLKARLRVNTAGFTIVELMIATLVFSVILLIITSGVVQFTKAYYGGINASTLQNTARGITDTLTQSIQFSGSPIRPTAGDYFCAGDYVYSFKQGVEYTGGAPTSANPGLYQQDQGTGSGCPSSAPSIPTTPVGVARVHGKELLGRNMRLSKMNVTPVPMHKDLYNVQIRLIYGDDDLLCSASVAGSCTSPNVFAALTTTPDLKCKLQKGSQFCAVSELSTVVQKRIN